MSMTSEPKAREEQVSKELPHDLEAEQRILGILIKHPEKVDVVADQLKDEHFYIRAHRLIYRTIYELYQTKGRISFTQIYSKLRRENSLSGAEAFLIDLTESFLTKADLEPSVEKVKEAWGKRRILEACDQVEKLIRNEEGESLQEYQAMAQKLIFAATSQQGSADDEAKDLVDVLTKCYTNLVERREGKVSYGLATMHPSVDLMTTGFKKKDLIILAGRPSMGKTALALNWCVQIAKKGQPVLIFSLEMDDEQIGDRFVVGELFKFRDSSGRPEIPSWEYATKLSDEKFRKAGAVFSDLYQLPIKVVDKRGLSVGEIRAKARKVKAEWPQLSLIVIDYLQLIRPDGDPRKSWTLQVGEIVRELRDLAGELDLPLILLSQLNRGVESRENKRPMMSDLRDSGNIEEFADVVAFVYRDEYYYPEEAEARGTKGQAEVIFAKQRKGQTGKVLLRFYPEFTRFVDETDRKES